MPSYTGLSILPALTKAEIEELEVVTTIIRAIQKYVGAYETAHPIFITFSDGAGLVS